MSQQFICKPIQFIHNSIAINEMPHINVYIHFVWSTKNRYPYLDSKALRQTVWQHIRENARDKGIFVDFVSGYSDHCHCLVSMGFNQTIQKTMQLIKGESAYWINKNGLTKKKFEWQDEYYAASVSEYHLISVRNYIRKQEEHHRPKTEMENYDELKMKYGLEIMNPLPPTEVGGNG